MSILCAPRTFTIYELDQPTISRMNRTVRTCLVSTNSKNANKENSQGKKKLKQRRRASNSAALFDYTKLKETTPYPLLG